MKKAVVRVICAIGQAGQLGLKGGLPWEGDRSPEFVADVARFFDVTRGHVLLAGPKTIASVPDFARADRELVVVRSSMALVRGYEIARISVFDVVGYAGRT